MQASAASQSNSPANIPSPQVKADANKADAASPFALLMQATARDSAKLDKKDAKESGDKSADDKPAAAKNIVLPTRHASLALRFRIKSNRPSSVR